MTPARVYLAVVLFVIIGAVIGAMLGDRVYAASCAVVGSAATAVVLYIYERSG